MLKFFAGLVVALCCVTGFSSTSFAQTGTCKAEIISTGHGAILDKAGPEKAIAAWRNDAVTRFGVFYGDPTKANEGKGIVVEHCGRTLLGLLVCEARGRPCIADAPQGGTVDTEIPCDPRNKYCDPTVRWVQTQLNIKGGFRLATDGVPGNATGAAIAAFRAKNNLAAGATIDDVLINALK